MGNYTLDLKTMMRPLCIQTTAAGIERDLKQETLNLLVIVTIKGNNGVGVHSNTTHIVITIRKFSSLRFWFVLFVFPTVSLVKTSTKTQDNFLLPAAWSPVVSYKKIVRCEAWLEGGKSLLCSFPSSPMSTHFLIRDDWGQVRSVSVSSSIVAVPRWHTRLQESMFTGTINHLEVGRTLKKFVNQSPLAGDLQTSFGDLTLQAAHSTSLGRMI